MGAPRLLALFRKHGISTQENPEGGIVSFEAPINASNVMLIDPKTGEATRIKRSRTNAEKDSGQRASAAGNPIPKPKA